MTEMTATIIVGLLIPLLGTMLGFRVLYERRNVRTTTEIIVGLCLRSDGGSIRVVLTHSGDGDEG